MSLIDKALSIAVSAHAGQKDRDGEAYILHPLQVGLMGTTDEERMTGFLHDVLEDTDVTTQQMLASGIPQSVVNAVQLLTHDKGITYFDYVQHIIDSKNPIALRVKFNDLTHNYQRGQAYPDLQAKHGRALEMITRAIQESNQVTRYEPNPDTCYAIFAAGCFWGVQYYMSRQPGVVRTLVGYTGGNEEYPSYERVRQHCTHHLEAVLVEYDPQQVTYKNLCQLFFEIHDPGQTDGQGPDLGKQYLSGIFYTDKDQLRVAQQLVDILRQKGHQVNTLITPTTTFWIAESYHQDYYENTGGNPYCHFRVKKF